MLLPRMYLPILLSKAQKLLRSTCIFALKG